MVLSEVDLLTAVAALIGVWMCGVTRIEGMLWGLALQTAMLAAVAATQGVQLHLPAYFVLAGVVIGVKAVPIPLYLSWIAGRIGIQRDRGAGVPPSVALIGGCGALAAGYFLTREVIGLHTPHPGAAGMALAHLLIGMLLMLTRRLAITQVVGFLVLENGIFLYALTQTHGMPLMVEMGVVLDVMVGVMVAGLVIFRLKGSFEHIDVTRLRGLKG